MDSTSLGKQRHDSLFQPTRIDPQFRQEICHLWKGGEGEHNVLGADVVVTERAGSGWRLFEKRAFEVG